MHFKGNSFSYILFGFLFLVLFFPTNNSLSAQNKSKEESKVYKIGFPQVPGIMYRNPDGSLGGFPIEITNYALKDEGVEFEWVEGSWNELFEKVKNGEIDALPGTQITAERKKYLDYLDESLYTIWSELYVRENTNFTGVSDLVGEKIGLVEGDNNSDGFETYIGSFHIEFKAVYYKSHADAVADLIDGNVYAMVGPSQSIFGSLVEGIKSSGLFFNPSDLNISFPKGKNADLREKLNHRLKFYRNDPNSVYNELYQKYGLGSFVHDAVILPLWVKYAIVITIILIIGFIGFTILLRFQVNVKTKQLQANEFLLRKTLEVGEMGIWNIDMETGKINISNEVSDLLGFERPIKEVSLLQMRNYVHPEDKNKGFAKLIRLIRMGKPVDEEFRILNAKNQEINTRHFAIVMKDNLGVPVSVQGIVLNITKQKKFEGELIKAKEKAEESEKLKSAFIANMSHEIRTPLNAIIGFSEIITDRDLEPSMRSKYFGIVKKQTDLLLNIINDVIDIANIESNTLHLELNTSINLNELLENIFESFVGSVPAAVKFKLEKGLTDEMVMYKSDEYRMTQILNNFVSNAIKHTRKGEIILGSRFNERNSKIELYVKDTGIGIAPHKHKLIFERFNKIDNYSQGAGLGLSISKSLAKILGGEIIVDSEKDKGSEFALCLDVLIDKEIIDIIKSKKNPKITSNGNVNFSRKRILVVEDMESNYMLLESFLTKIGIKYERALNGNEAVEKTLSSEFDLILMDVKMPVMGGYEAVKIIKKEKPHVPIIAVTAHAFGDDKQKAINSGCDDYLAKPIDYNSLLQKISKYLS